MYYDNRALAMRQKGEYDPAIKDDTEAMRLDPKNAVYVLNRGVIWERKKDYDRAMADYTASARLDPDYADAFAAQAWLWATNPDDTARDAKKALEAARKACELSEYKAWGCIDNLAAALAESGQFDEAVKQQKKALEFKDVTDQDRKDMEERLKLYQDHKPYRMPK